MEKPECLLGIRPQCKLFKYAFPLEISDVRCTKVKHDETAHDDETIQPQAMLAIIFQTL
jgi:hypothetical protein